jgi:hypothetical protein
MIRDRVIQDQQERHIYQYQLRMAIQRINQSITIAGASGPTRSESEKWRRPQCLETRYALARVSAFPLAIHSLRTCQSATGSPQSSFDKLQESHVFGNATFAQNFARRNGKEYRICAEAVED